MRRRASTRAGSTGLLARPPCTDRDIEARLADAIVDPIEQLNQLADLRAAGYLSVEEFERQKAKVLGTTAP